MQFEHGDLLRTTRELVIRKDGFCFNDADVDSEGKIPKQWFDGYDELPAGSFLTYVRDAVEDDEYFLVRRDLVGRHLTVRRAFCELVSRIADAQDTTEDDDESGGSDTSQ